MQAVGQYFLTCIFLSSLLIFYLLFKYINFVFPDLLNLRKLENFLFWNATIRNMFESYLDFTLMAFTQLYSYGFQWDTKQQISSTVLLITGLVIYVLTPAFLTWFFTKNVKNFPKKEFKEKF